ncbi:MAG: glycine/betaine ABC transporter, partial [Candidatus Chloroheliales bacterium]
MIELLSKAYDYVQHNSSRFWEAVGTHLRISLTALVIAIIITV